MNPIGEAEHKTDQVASEVAVTKLPDALLRTALAASQELVVILDRKWNVVWSNDSFRVACPGTVPGCPFRSFLSEASADNLEAVASESDRFDVEVHHLAPGGMLIVSYRFLAYSDDLIVGLGVDRSSEMEVVSQMAVLIEELEREVNERIRLTEELKALAVTDGLTGVYNRRRFDERLADEWQRWVRYGERFGLMLIDIDHFKSVNDTYGHLVGDEVLRRLGKTLRGFVRKEDVVARYGGEEFALIALGVSLEETEELAERLRVRILETPMPAPVGNITVSLGISSPESTGVETAAEVLNRADAALYCAKKSGRNQVVVSDR